jgi:hypothetical protein
MLGKFNCCLTDAEEADRQAHLSRVAILHVNLGRRGTRALLRFLQTLGIFARA